MTHGLFKPKAGSHIIRKDFSPKFVCFARNRQAGTMYNIYRTVTYVESYRWFVRNTKEKMQDKYAGTMNVLLHKGHSWFFIIGEIPFEGKRGTYLCIFQKRKYCRCVRVF